RHVPAAHRWTRTGRPRAPASGPRASGALPRDQPDPLRKGAIREQAVDERKRLARVGHAGAAADGQSEVCRPECAEDRGITQYGGNDLVQQLIAREAVYHLYARDPALADHVVELRGAELVHDRGGGVLRVRPDARYVPARVVGTIEVRVGPVDEELVSVEVRL